MKVMQPATFRPDLESKVAQPTTKQGRRRIPELDILRGVAIVGVLVLHSSFEGRFTNETMAVQAIMARLFDWSVLAFFFSSGFLHDRSVPFAVILKKRFLSLMVPFFIYNTFYNLCFFGMAAAGGFHAGAFAMNPKALGLILFQSPAFQLYFLPYLFLISIAVSALEKLSRQRYQWAYIAILSLVLFFYVDRGYPQISHGADINNLPMYIAMFIIGLISRPFIEKPLAGPGVMLLALAGMLGVLVFSRSCVVSLLVPPLLTAMAAGIRTIRESKLFLHLGNVSGSIYVWHTPLLLPAITRLLAACGIPSLFNLFGSIILTLVTCVLLRLGLDAMFLRVMKVNAPKYVTL
jgi:peptidoglycan/LPS O-acetylase OafA/YrhL